MIGIVAASLSEARRGRSRSQACRVVQSDEYNFARDDLRLVLRDQFLKARIVAQRVPFPTEFQIVERDAVIDAVHRAWSFQQALDERNSEIVFAYSRVDESEVAIHDCAVKSVFRFGL